MSEPYWTNRLARPDETAAILNLVRTVHGDGRAASKTEYFSWRYLSDTEFRADIVMAEADGQPVGIQPMALFDWRWGAERLKGVMYTGVLTHPDHRRRGIFRTVIDSSNEQAAQRGAAFVMTLPNDSSLPGFLRFGGWHYPGLIPLAIKGLGKRGAWLPSPTSWLLRLLFRCKPLGGADEVTYEFVTHMPDELDEAADQFARDCDCLMIRRTASYWNWRYFMRPGERYRAYLARRGSEVVGAVVTSSDTRMGLNVGMIVDVVAAGGLPVLRGLIRRAEQDLQECGLRVVTCQATSPMMQEALRQEGYWIPPPKRLPKHFHFVFRPTSVPGLPRLPDRISDWHLTFGDSDNV